MFAQISLLLLLSAFSLKSNDCANPSTVSSIPLPAGYERIPVSANSFGAYLRGIRLKADKTVYLFNSEKKTNQSAQYAVLDISTGNKDLQQCADAVMRLRAEYLKQQNSPICFNDNAGKNYCWSNYRQRGWQGYLETVFGMCGTLSLQKQLKTQSWEKLNIGDVIIKGGSPGHAVIIMDIARHKTTGSLIFVLAQSYMPAQDTHVLLNRKESRLSPWYSIPNDYLETPEWTFLASQLHTWP
jgi:Domain of unknown function (4846)